MKNTIFVSNCNLWEAVEKASALAKYLPKKGILWIEPQ